MLLPPDIVDVWPETLAPVDDMRVQMISGSTEYVQVKGGNPMVSQMESQPADAKEELLPELTSIGEVGGHFDRSA